MWILAQMCKQAYRLLTDISEDSDNVYKFIMPVISINCQEMEKTSVRANLPQ